MDRRKSLKLLATGVIATGAIVTGCKTDAEKSKSNVATTPEFALDRSPDEAKREKELLAKDKIFTPHEMATIAVLADIIIPKDEISGSATDAKVPDFIEFICRDMPKHEIPMKGGLRWLDVTCLKQFGKSFKDCSSQEQITIVDKIAYPEKATPAMKQGAAFFSLMRDLTASGFYTSQIGVKDVGYEGNAPNQWKGVPDDVLKQYNLSYTQKELDECVKF